MIKTYIITHDLASNTIELTTIQDGSRIICRNYHPSQRDELLLASEGVAAPYVQIAGWTDAYITNLLAKEAADAAAAQAKIEADAAASREAAIQAQMAIIAEAQARLAAAPV